MSLGIRTIFVLAANQTFTNSAALALLTGITSPIAASETQRLKIWIPFSVGATGGIRYQIVVPAGGTIFRSTTKIVNTVAPSITTSQQAASAAVNAAVANAGSHWIEIDAIIVNGLTAGSVDLQAAQDTADALTLTIFRGATMEVVKL